MAKDKLQSMASKAVNKIRRCSIWLGIQSFFCRKDGGRKSPENGSEIENETQTLEVEKKGLVKDDIKFYEEEQRKAAIKKIRCLKTKIMWKQRSLIVPIILIVFVVLCIMDIMFGSISCSGSETDGFIRRIVNAILTIPDIENRISATILLWILVVGAVYGICLVIKSFRRYQNAWHKVNILIIRLELFTDKDIISRLDRELEMIYRILES